MKQKKPKGFSMFCGNRSTLDGDPSYKRNNKGKGKTIKKGK